MPEESDENKISKLIDRLKGLDKERKETTKQIIKNLNNQKRIEKEHLDLVEMHLKYWNSEIEKTNAIDEERLNVLRDRLKMEERIRNKINDHIKHIDKEIKFQEEHIY